MNFGFPATVAVSSFAIIPAAFFVVPPVGVPTFIGVIRVPPLFPFGIPFTIAGNTFIAIPAARLATTPAVI